MVKFKGIALKDKGTAGAHELQSVRKIALDQITDRFANRSILDQFQWLDLTTWPDELPPNFGEENLSKICKFWENRLHRWSITFSDLKAEFDKIKAIFPSFSRPIDSWSFWKGIIINQNAFPRMHLFLRMCLALTPSNAQVEAAFSRLRQILTDHRTLLDPHLVEQLLILALDAENWLKYDVQPILDRMKNQVRRASFRLAREDKGQQRSGKRQKRKRVAEHPPSDQSAYHSGSSSSGSSMEDNSSSESH